MRPTFLFSCMIFIIMSFLFCTKILNPGEEGTLVHHNGYLEDTISAESTTLSIPFLFSATESWTAVSSDDSWLKVNTSNGEAKEQITLDISTEKNTKTKRRRARIFVETSQDDFSLYIVQLADGSLPTEGNGTLMWDDDFDLEQSIYADATILNEDFVFTATESWTAVSSEDSWLIVNISNGEAKERITLGISTKKNETTTERTATITLSTSKDEVVLDEVVLTVTQLGKSHIIVSSPQKISEIEGFRKNKIDVKAYDGGTDGHDSDSDGGGYVIHDFPEERTEKRTVYIPYNITLANPDDYTWKATSSFNLKDAGLVSSVNYIDDANTDKEKHVTGDDGEGVYLFVDVTGPGDEDITGTLTIETVLKDADNINTEVYIESFKLTIITSCGVGETTTASLVWDDRNRGVHVPDKAVGSVAGYYANVAEDDGGGFVGDRDYKGDYYNWGKAMLACPAGTGWRLPTNSEFETLVSIDIRYSKKRAFVVSATKSDVYPYYYTGAWFPLAGWAGGSGVVTGNYWSSTDTTRVRAYSLYLYPTGGRTNDTDSQAFGYSVRCVKNAP